MQELEIKSAPSTYNDLSLSVKLLNKPRMDKFMYSGNVHCRNKDISYAYMAGM